MQRTRLLVPGRAPSHQPPRTTDQTSDRRTSCGRTIAGSFRSIVIGTVAERLAGDRRRSCRGSRRRPISNRIADGALEHRGQQGGRQCDHLQASTRHTEFHVRSANLLRNLYFLGFEQRPPKLRIWGSEVRILSGAPFLTNISDDAKSLNINGLIHHYGCWAAPLLTMSEPPSGTPVTVLVTVSDSRAQARHADHRSVGDRSEPTSQASRDRGCGSACTGLPRLGPTMTRRCAANHGNGNPRSQPGGTRLRTLFSDCRRASRHPYRSGRVNGAESAAPRAP